MKILLLAILKSASDRPVSPYNSETEAQTEVPQAPEDRAR